MPIGFGGSAAVVAQTNVTSIQVNITVSGANPILFVGAISFDVAAGPHITGVSSNVDGALVEDVVHNDGNLWVHLFRKSNPTPGAHVLTITSSVTADNLWGAASFFTGASATGQPDATAFNKSALTSELITSLTTVADNCWLVGFAYSSGGPNAAGAGTVIRQGGSDAFLIDSDSAKTPAGSDSLIMTGGNGAIVMVIASFAPHAGASAVLTGTAIGGITEADIVAGGKTIIITLTGDTFIPS